MWTPPEEHCNNKTSSFWDESIYSPCAISCEVITITPLFTSLFNLSFTVVPHRGTGLDWSGTVWMPVNELQIVFKWGCGVLFRGTSAMKVRSHSCVICWWSWNVVRSLSFKGDREAQGFCSFSNKASGWNKKELTKLTAEKFSVLWQTSISPHAHFDFWQISLFLPSLNKKLEIKCKCNNKDFRSMFSEYSVSL